jgi:hypothetical protein
MSPKVDQAHESFWVVLIIWLGTALAFYLVGYLLMILGLWLWHQERTRWICANCMQPKIGAAS